MSENLKFKISSALKNIIGKDLITDDAVAVFELVKNSYDALATKVIITFEDDAIYIADNGKGMSYEDIINKWLFVAYSAKKDGSEDLDYRDKIQARRFYAGSKGVGRFSCDRLGERLELYSKVSSSEICNKLEVNWQDFDLDQKDEFADISVKYEKVSQYEILFPEESSSGTILKIKSLNKSWDRSSLISLKQSLEKLINPFSESRDFSIELVCDRELAKDNSDKRAKESPRFRVNGVIENTVLDILTLRTTKIKVVANRYEITTQIVDRGVDIYTIKSKNRNYPLLEDIEIDLFYLNRSAKYTFSLRMGMPLIEYGSIFLFKNGFRVYPYGTPGDDSWGLDYRAQQGRARYLGTRDLFGSVQVISDNATQFKEVSSRDGGLIKTEGYNQLLKLFTQTQRRLERYVVGVLWGEGFIKRKYFENDQKALEARARLQNADSESDNIASVRDNIGSKLDFLQIMKNLVKEKDVEIISFNEGLVDIVSNKMLEIRPQFLYDLEVIAKETGNDKLLSALLDAEDETFKLQKEVEELARRLHQEQQKTTLKDQALVKEKEQNLVIKAEKEQIEKKLEIEVQKSRYFAATRNITPEARDLLHSIKISSSEMELVSKNINRLAEKSQNKSEIYKELDYLNFHIERIEKFSSLLTKADIDFLGMATNIDVVQYIKDYLVNYIVSVEDIIFEDNTLSTFYRVIPPLDLSVILDNLINNSKKAKATKIIVSFEMCENKLFVDFSDNGNGLPDKYLNNVNAIFEVGVGSTRGGSGVGLSFIKETLRKNFFGDIKFLGNNLRLKGATFRLIF